jgi:molybdopterin-guanine dinucleotide biosynthesis protein A
VASLFSDRLSGKRTVAKHTRIPLACGYVLAGGASTRFGQDKALAKLGEKPALKRMLETLGESSVRETLVVGAKARYGKFGARCIHDKWPGEGPLGGIVTALRRSAADKYGYRWNLIVSCDMPFLTGEWLAYVCARAAASEAEVVVPRSGYGLEPLCACWRTDSVGQLQKLFAEGVRKVTEAMNRIRMEVLDEEDWKRFDSAGRLFWNMNTPQDYEDAVKAIAEERR